VPETIGRCVEANHCRDIPLINEFPVLVEDGTKIRSETYTGAQNSSEVALYVIEGGGHTWPGRKPTLLFLGKSTQNLNANDVIWDFFSRHHLQGF
jgi:polyhydroxybutyrate depolymerase